MKKGENQISPPRQNERAKHLENASLFHLLIGGYVNMLIRRGTACRALCQMFRLRRIKCQMLQMWRKSGFQKIFLNSNIVDLLF